MHNAGQEMNGGFYLLYGKRFFDFTASVLAVVLLSPLFVAIWIVLFFCLGPPVLFRQIRPGLNAQPFVLYKFRSMRNERDLGGKPLPDAARVTRTGMFLRSLSLDELPELINVLKGEMSLVGPRPLMMEYLGRYTAEQARRHELTPGITGWAQINGRNDLTWEEKFSLDLWYLDHRSFKLDITILSRTVWKVLCREGISREGYVSSPEFMGTNGKSDGEGCSKPSPENCFRQSTRGLSNIRPPRA